MQDVCVPDLFDHERAPLPNQAGRDRAGDICASASSVEIRANARDCVSGQHHQIRCDWR